VSRPAIVEFDHHSPAMPENNWAVFSELRATCPVAYTEAHGAPARTWRAPAG
jgi:hypothetical protein